MVNYTFNPNSDRPAQSRELTEISPPENDIFLLDLGAYIADGINYDYLSRYPSNEENNGSIAIREIVDYDIVNIDLSRLPLLKLYRLKDTFESMTSRDTQGVIAYCLSYPQQDMLPGLMQYMSRSINVMLDCYAEDHEQCRSNVVIEQRISEYRIMLNTQTLETYPFLRVNFKFHEF